MGADSSEEGFCQMNLSLQRLAAAVLALALLAGCSTATPAPETKPVELVVYSLFGFPREALDEAIDLYEDKHPNVNVKVREPQGAQLFTQEGKPNPAVLEDGDLVLMPEGMSRSFYHQGLLRDLTSVRLPAFDPSVDALIDDLTKSDGVRFALPISLQPAMFYLNQDTFQQAGLEVPPVDWTIQEFEQALLQLKAAGQPPHLFLMMVLEPLMRSFGGKTYDSATQQWYFDTPESQQALAWIGRLVKDGLLEYTSATGPVTIRFGGPGAPALTPMLGNMRLLAPGTLLQPFPRGPAGRSVPVTATLGVILSSSANPEVATDFLTQMLSGPEQQLALARGGLRPVISDAKAVAAWREQVGDRTADATELSWENAYVDNGWRRNEFISLMGPFFEGKAELEPTLASIKAQFGQ